MFTKRLFFAFERILVYLSAMPFPFLELIFTTAGFERAPASLQALRHLAAERFILIEFPLPPLAEQEAIVEAVEDQLSVIEHLETDLDAKLKKRASACAKPSCATPSLGQLVPQDPNDEPAQELLKRIAAEREERARQAHCRKQPQGITKPSRGSEAAAPHRKRRRKRPE